MAQIYANGAKGHHKFTLDVTETATSIENNTSTLSYTFKLSPVQKGWDWSGWGSKISYSIDINGTKYTGTIPSYDGSSTVTLKSGKDIPIEHSSDGTKTINISFSVSDGAGQSYTCGNASQSGTMALTTIPRATSCPNLDGYIGRTINVILLPASNTFKHRLYYEYGTEEDVKTGAFPSVTEYFSDKTTFTLDSSFYSYTPGKTGTGKLTLYTYTSDGTRVGTSSGTITIRCDEEECKPMIAVGISDINSKTTALTSSSSNLVKGHSTAKIVYVMTPLNGATISSQKINGLPLTASPYEIKNVSTGTFNVEVIDSRGFITTEKYTNKLIEYIPLTLDFNAYRPTPTGSEIKVSFQGNCFNGSFGKVTNALQLSWKYRKKGDTNWTNGGTFTSGTHYTISGNRFYSNSDISLGNLFDYQTNFEIAIDCKDKLEDASTYKTVPKGMPVIYWEDDLAGVNGDFVVNEEVISDGTKVSPTQPEKKEKIWIQKSKNHYYNITKSTHNLTSSNGVYTQYQADNDSVPYIKFQKYKNGSYVSQISTIMYSEIPVNGVVSCTFTTDSSFNEMMFGFNGSTIDTTILINLYGLENNQTYTLSFYMLNKTQGSISWKNLQLERGSKATEYEPGANDKIFVKNDNGIYEEFVSKKSKNILRAYLSSGVTVTTNSDQRAKIPFDKYGVIGDKLTYNSSNNTIVIGKGVSQISVRGSVCYTHNSSLGNAGIGIMKNGGVLTQKLYSSYGTTRTYANMDIHADLISVVEGDIIHLTIRSVATTNHSIALDYGLGVTNLVVEVIE